jgi:hypothetical protein
LTRVRVRDPTILELRLERLEVKNAINWDVMRRLIAKAFDSVRWFWAEMEGPNLFRLCTSITIGNGERTSFWKGRWLNGHAPQDIAPECFRLAWRKNHSYGGCSSTEQQMDERTPTHEL